MGEPLSEYLLCRKTPVWGEGVIQTSMLVVRKALLEQVPFATGLSRHQDWDWLLRAFCNDGVGCEWVLQPMAIFHMNSSEERVSRDRRWQPSLKWAIKYGLITKRAFIHFVALIITPKFSLRRDLSHLPKLLRAAKEYGMADARAIIFGLLHLLFSERFLRVAARMARVTPSRPSRSYPFSRLTPVDYSNEGAALVRNPSSWSRNSAVALFRYPDLCLLANCLSVLAFACT